MHTFIARETLYQRYFGHGEKPMLLIDEDVMTNLVYSEDR